MAIPPLSDVMYRYTPTITSDEASGDVIGIDQKFKADKLQKTYQEYADIFSFSKAQIKSGIDDLVDRNLLTRVVRKFKAKTGLTINNVMYLEPVLENIVRISNKIRSPKKEGGYPLEKTPMTPKKTRSSPY